MSFKISSNYVDIYNRRIFPATITVDGDIITKVKEEQDKTYENYILPGFIDAHIHIESSMLVPYEFAKTAVKHGTVATISDPHEIANVLGIEGVEYMLENAKDAGLKFHFGAPSCVPATSFETAGAVIDAAQVKSLLDRPDIYYLSEMMNYPGVLNKDPEVMTKISYAHSSGKPVDGHAPGLMGEDAINYISQGISTDHECYTYEEAKHKLDHGMKVLIREGSAAKNFEALHSLINQYSDKMMFCSDDKHPDDLLVGHINELVVRALQLGYDLFDVLKMVCINPVHHYKMQVGTLRENEKADFILVEDLITFTVMKTCINGAFLYDGNEVNLLNKSHAIINNFNVSSILVSDIPDHPEPSDFPIIKALDGQLITEKLKFNFDDEDILTILVVNRYKKAPIAKGFISGFGLQAGAIASTVAHDSHNIICVGKDSETMVKAINILIENKGGLAFCEDNVNHVLPLPIAGLMSDQSCESVADQYTKIDQLVKKAGCQLKSPFMTLSFMALLVIPKIKMSDLGLFDAEGFRFY
jgi:adenine deaminase